MKLYLYFLALASISFSAVAEVSLTKEEQQWIIENPVVNFTGDPNWLPYEAFDSNGNYIGIVAEHIKIISSLSGLKFKISPSETWSESVQKAKLGEVDVLSETDDSALSSYLKFTTPYISNPIVIVMKQDENYVENINIIKDRKIALIKDYGYASKIREAYRNIDFLTVDDIQHGLISVSSGEIDVLLCTLALCSYTISDLGLSNVKIIGKTEFETKLALGVQKDLPYLHSILNKSIANITKQQQQDIFAQWVYAHEEVVFDYGYLLKLSALFLAVISVFVFWNRKLANEIKLRIKTETENKIIVKELRAQAQIIDQIHDSVIATDLNGIIIKWNKGSDVLFGYKESEMMGKHISKVYPESEITRLENETIPTLVKNSSHEVETKFLHKSGRNFYGHVALSMLYDDEDAVGMMGYSVDIDAKKNAEIALKESEALLEKAQKITHIGHWKLYPNTGEITGSDELYRIFGIGKDDASLEVFIETVHQDDREMDIAAIQRGAEHGESWDIEHRLVCRDGTEKWVHAIGEAIKDENGNVVELLGTVQDITNEKLKDIELEESSRLFKAMFESIPDAIVYADPERKIRMVNSAAVEMFGYTEAELQGHKTKMLYSSKEDFIQQGVKHFNPKSIKQSSPKIIAYQSKSGSEIPGETLGTAVKSSDGEILGYLGIIRDITERQLLENELESYRDSLESQIETRTFELIIARDEAEKASDAKSEFLSSMSHELRTPLNAILGFGQMLELDNKKFSEVQKSNVQEVLFAGHHLLNLINQVLNLAQIESGSFQIDMKKTDLTSVIQESLKLMHSEFKRRNIEVVDNISKEKYFINADALRLKQIILNLLSNAVKYNRESGTITLDRRLKDNRIYICVTDTGMGISEIDMSKLYNPFERLNAEENIEGTGIGLTITKHLCEVMGGNIGVESTLGEGSTFWVELGLAE